jgi:hypothetical protein
MTYKDALARGDTPHSAALTSGLANEIARKFEQELARMVQGVGREAMTPVSFRGFVGGLWGMLAAIGRETLEQLLQAQDEARPSVEVGGERLRYRGMVEAEWLTPFGKATVLRRTYRADGRGKPSVVPLDDACGMRGRFMTAEVEEMAALGMAMLTAPEVAKMLDKALPEGPSATAIQNAVHQRGAEIATHRAAIETAIDEQAPMSPDGDTLVVSYDGVMTPMREGTDVAWREAGVATVSVYGQGAVGPEKRDTRFLARMPESGMKTLLEQVADQVARANLGRSFRQFVLLCDGKDAIWSAASSQPVLHDAVWIVDFYHVAENLMKAAVAIFGEGEEADRWHSKLRDKLLLDDNAVDNTIRTMRRGRCRIPRTGKARKKALDNAVKYFKKHKNRMRYADFIARGLPIGSGPVEAAAKNIVQARLKRSGMRWSRDGGQHVLDLRAFLKSNRWEPMWNTLLKAA